MTNLSYQNYVGIDVSKASLDVHILPSDTHFQVTNDENGFAELLFQLMPLSNCLVVMEASGGYEKAVAHALVAMNFDTSIVNPRQVRDFAKAMNRLAKTDKIDAKVIALFAQMFNPKQRVILNENQQELAALQNRRKQLIDMIGMEKNRSEKARKTTKESIEKIVEALEDELEVINQKLKELVKEDTAYTKKSNLLTSIKGVGEVVANAVLAYMPEIGTLSSKQISALAGLAPFNRDSGTFRGKRMISGGRAPLRAALYMSTLVAIRHNKQIREFYQSLCSKGKAKKIAIVACMHKILIIMNAMIKNNKSWQYE